MMLPQLARKVVKGDGNCFPRSISEILGNLSPDEVREFFVAEVVNNPDEYNDFVDDVNVWAENMAKCGTWADGIAVKATANCMNVPIAVIRKRNPGQVPTVFLPPSDGEDDLPPILVELDEEPGGEHYNPLVRREEPGAAPLRKRHRNKKTEETTSSKRQKVDWAVSNSPTAKQIAEEVKRWFSIDVAGISSPGDAHAPSSGPLPGGVDEPATLPLSDGQESSLLPCLSDDDDNGSAVPANDFKDAHELDAVADPDAVVEAPAVEAEAVEAEASIPVDADAAIPAALAAEVSIPSRRLKKKRKRMLRAAAEAAEESIPEEAMVLKAEASNPMTAVALEADAAIPSRRLKKRRKRTVRVALEPEPERSANTPEPEHSAKTPEPEHSAKTPEPEQSAKTVPKDGCFVKGTILDLEEEGRCRKCQNVVHKSKAKISGKGKNIWICYTCNSKSVQLYNIYGKWPPANFKLLSADQQTEYYDGIKFLKDQATLQKFTDNYLRTTHESNKGAKDKTVYLPLSVWKTRGFSAKRIKKFCKDTQSHSVLGKLYGLQISHKWEGQEEKQVRGEDIIVTDRPEPPTSGPSSKPAGPLKQSREEKKAAMERIRIEKALATQEARAVKQSMSLCQKYLRRVTKLSFNLSKSITPKFVKSLPKTTQQRLVATKAKVAQLQKSLMASIMNGAKTDLSEHLCENTCKEGELLIDQLSQQQALKASLI